MNVWVAWLNLENLHGSPPEEALMALFQRALQQTDQKKLYLALLTILESSGKVCIRSALICVLEYCLASSSEFSCVKEWPIAYMDLCPKCHSCAMQKHS